MEELKDIKTLMVIEDFSLYILVALSVIVLILLIFIIKKIVTKLREQTPIKLAKKELKKVDLSEAKKSAYTVSKYAKLLSDEDFTYLDRYKYKNETIDFTKDDLEKLKRFLDGI